MSATSGGGNGSMRMSGGGGGGGGGGSVSEGSEAGESSQSTMSVTDSPSTSFQANHEGNITKISLAEGSGAGAVHVDMTGSSVNLTLDERQTAEGVVNMGFDNDEGANRGDAEFKSINGSIKTDKVSEAVNLELVNMVPYSNGNGTSYGVPVNGIPVKKDSEGADMSSPYDEYFVPVNEHKKYMRGEKLYVTKDKRRPASWRKCLSWIVACAVLSVVLIVAILAGTGVILSQDSDMVKEASVGRNFAGGDTKPLVTNGSISGSLDKSTAGQWLSHANNMTHMYVPRSIELGLPIDNLEWNSAYLNSNSTEYQKLLSATENQLKMILFDKEILDSDDTNLSFNMVNISQDHFKVLYRMGWNFKQGANNAKDPITVEDVRNKIIESLSRNQGFIDMYHIDVEGIDVGHVLNVCQFNNGGCSHICYYNYLNQQFTCTCPTHLVLDSSLKTCVEWSGSSEQDYGSVPKQSYSGEHFESDVYGSVSQYPHDDQSHHGHGSTFEHGSTYEHESSHGQGSVHEKESTYEHGSEYEEGSDHEHGLTHGHGLDHGHGPEQYEPEKDHEHGAKQHESERDYEQGAKQHEPERDHEHDTKQHESDRDHEHGAKQHESDRDHEHGAKQHESERDHDYGLTSGQGSTQEYISTHDPEHEYKNSHGLATEQGSPHEEAPGHEHGHQAIHEHGLASEHGLEHGLDHDHSSHIDSKNNFQTTTVHMEGGFMPQSEDNGHTDHDSLGEQYAEPAPEPTPKPSSGVESEDALHHIGHNQPHENSYSVISDGNLEKDGASQTDHTKAAHTTGPTFYKKDQPHSNIGIILNPHDSHQGEHEESTHNLYNESHNDHKSAPGLVASPNYNHTFESTPESSSEYDTQSQSSQSFGSDSDLSGSSPSSTPTSVVQEHSEKDHSLGFDNGQVHHTVSYMDGHEKKNEFSHGDVKPSESAQTTSYSGLNNHGTEGNNHVPLLEEVLLQDSSLNATKHHEDSKFKTQSQTFLDNVEVNAMGKPIVEEVVIGESSPKTEESTSGSILTQESKNENENLNKKTEHKNPNQKYPLNGNPVISPANEDGTTQAYESNTEEGPVQIDYSQKKGQDEMIIHDSMKKKFDDQITHTTTIPDSTSIKNIESDSDSARGITDKHEENKAVVDNTSSETLKSSGESVPSKYEGTHVYETTMSPEGKSTSPVNSHTDFSVDEPEPKIKTRIENQPIPKNQHESRTEIPQAGNRRAEQTLGSSEVKKEASSEEPTEFTGSGNIISSSNKPKQNETMIHAQKTEEIENNKNIQFSVPKIMNEKFDKSGDGALKDLESDIKETTASTVTESLQETPTYVTRHDPNHNEKFESPESVVYDITTEKPHTTGVFIHEVKNKEAGNSEEKTADGKLESQENTTTKSADDSVSKKTITPEVLTSHVETTTISLHAKNSNSTEKEKTSNEELMKTTESYSVSQSENDRHSSQVNPDKTHSDEFSNNIKDEAVDNDEFNTLLDKEYKNEYSNDGKDVFNKYPSKPTFLKGDKKKLKDFGKLDKTESEKVTEEETTKPYSSEKDSGIQKHVTESSFVPNYRFSTEHIPVDVNESTKHDEFSSEGIPVLPYNVYNAENPDFGLLHTVSPAFETETYAADNNDETRILKTYSTDDGFDSKEEEYKSEKDFPKQDKDHKYDKQKGGKKKDLKKKGSTKDGKNVEVDDKKYYTEITGEKGENYHGEGNPENSKGFTNTGVTPNERIYTTHVHNNDETKLTVLPNEQNVPERDKHSDTNTPSKSQKHDSQSVQLETTHSHSNADDSAEDNESERRTSISENSNSSSKSISGSKQPHVNAEEKSAITEYPTQTISLRTENGDNMKQYKGSSSAGSATGVHEINIDTATEPYTEGETSIYHHKGFSTTEIKNKNDFYAHSIGSSTMQTHKDDMHPNMNKDEVHSEKDSNINLPATQSESSQHETSTPNDENIGHHTYMKIEKESMGDNSGQKSVGENVNNKTQEAVSKKDHILIDREPTNSGTSGTHGTSSIITYKTNTPDNNRDSTVYSITNSSTGQRTFEINDQDNRDFRLTNSSFYAFGDGKLPFRRVINVTVPEGGGPFIVRNYTTITGNRTGPKLKPFFRGQGGSFYDGQEFRYNTTHTFVPPPVNFTGTFGNGTVFRIENGSLPGTVFDGSFDPQEGHYHMFTNSTGTYVYSGTQPSFKIKGNSGDFGRSSVYILGNNSRSNAYFGNSTGPLRSHRVIFKNSTVFAVKNLSNSDASYPVAKHQSAATTGNETAKKSFELTPSSLTAGTVYKVGDYFGYISKCAAGQFQCLNGTSKRGSACIKLSSKCDSINDCSDGSDEAGCIENGCPGNFQCADGTCLTRHLVCNGIVECSDGSDEKQCENWKCEFDEFKCPSGRCIPVVWQCDGKADCDNHTDEQNCQRSCGNDEYLCPEGWCVPLTYRCNGIKECSNGEDEQLCDCSLDEFKCQSGGCVRKDQVCNGLDDCSDRSDEWDCMQIKPNSTLLQIRTSSGEFEPVCADNWSPALSDHVCASFGYSSSAPVEVESPSTPFSNEKFFYMLKNETVLGDSNFLVHLMRTNQTCSSKKWVDISCQEFSCGSRSMTDGSSVEGRLVGGMNAIAGQWPSVSLLYNIRNMHSCTANILTPRWVLASYNCLKMGNKNLNQKDWKFFGGSTVFEPEDGETRKILAIIPHPQVKFNQFLFSNDLALVKLDEPLSFSNSMGAVCLPEQEIQPRQICVTAGWGMNGPEDKNIRQQLQYLPVPTMDLTDCNSTEHYSGFVTDDKICAGYNSAEKSLCYNEEGAPLMCVNDRGEWELQGMLSYHSNCGRGSHPSIFSSIKRVKDWIVQTIGNSVERKITFAS